MDTSKGLWPNLVTIILFYCIHLIIIIIIIISLHGTIYEDMAELEQLKSGLNEHTYLVVDIAWVL